MPTLFTKYLYKLSGSVNNRGSLAIGAGFGVMFGEINENSKVLELENKIKMLEKKLEKIANKN